jgi:D-sedoheptulose 7-phosphate isomerase
MAASDDVDHCFVVRSESVHRIQEAQDGLVSDLWSVVQEHLGAVPATGGWHD